MSIERIAFHSVVPVPRDFAWSCYVQPGMFDRLAPPWQQVRTVQVTGSVKPGDRRVIELQVGPARLKWIAVHEDYDEGYLFSDRQIRGPFRHWRHRHRFADEGESGCRISDEIEFELPVSLISHPIGASIARGELRRMFQYRHAVAFFDFVEHYRLRAMPRRTILVQGSPETAVRQLRAFLSVGGHELATDKSGPSAGVITVSGDFESGLAVDVTVGGERQARVRSAMVLDHSTNPIRIAQACQFFDFGDDASARRSFQWTTLDDVIAAVHRILLQPDPGFDAFVRHPSTATMEGVVDALRDGQNSVRLGLLPAALRKSLDSIAESAPASPDLPVILESRYHSVGDALRTTMGRR